MDDNVTFFDNSIKKLEDEQNSSAAQINNLKTILSRKKISFDRLKGKPAEFRRMNLDPSQVERQLELLRENMDILRKQIAAKQLIIDERGKEIAQLERRKQKDINDGIKAEKDDMEKEKNGIKAGSKYIAGAKNLHGHMGSRNIGLLFIIIFISAVIIDWCGRSGETFGVIETSFVNIPLIYLVQLIFILWFYIDTKEIIDTVLLSFIFVLNIYGTIPFFDISIPYIFPMVILALFRLALLKDKPMYLNSIKTVVIILIIGVILFAILSTASASIVSYAAVLPSLSGDSTSNPDDALNPDGTSDPDSSSNPDGTSTSPSSIYSNFMCFISPLHCPVPEDNAEDDGDTPTPVSDGTVNEVNYALARPTMTQSETLDPGDYTTIEWIVKTVLIFC